MAKYGLFGGNLQDPMQTFEGDSIAQNGDHVYVYATETKGGRTKNVQVAAVKLGDGQVVKKIG
jgi:hypothetical protein